MIKQRKKHWFKSMSSNGQKAYLKQHPKSKYKRVSLSSHTVANHHAGSPANSETFDVDDLLLSDKEKSYIDNRHKEVFERFVYLTREKNRLSGILHRKGINKRGEEYQEAKNKMIELNSIIKPLRKELRDLTKNKIPSRVYEAEQGYSEKTSNMLNTTPLPTKARARQRIQDSKIDRPVRDTSKISFTDFENMSEKKRDKKYDDITKKINVLQKEDQKLQRARVLGQFDESDQKRLTEIREQKAKLKAERIQLARFI